MASDALAAIVLKPAAIVVVAILLVALVFVVVLTGLIKRGTRAGRATPQPAPQARSQPVRRPAAPVAPAAPVDMQDRLRRLTSVYDTADETTSRVKAPGHGSGPLAPRTTGALSAPPAPVGFSAPPPTIIPSAQDAGIDDATRFFGDAEAEPDTDSTTFFGAEEDLPDATVFFGAEEDLPDATTYFGAEAEPGAHAPDEYGTQFFGLEDDVEAAVAPSETTFFGPLDEEEEDQARSAPRHVTARADDDGAGAPHAALDGHTGLLHALPPTLKDEVWDDEGRPLSIEQQHETHNAREQHDAREQHETHDAREQRHDTRLAAPSDAHGAGEELMASTGFLAALPPSMPAVDATVLEAMRERLASVTAPEVLALSVIDDRGRVLAGEADNDLAGELHALMDESGLGQAADIEQPVRLADDSPGMIMLVPTGAGALLGALVRDGENPEITRDSLRGLAHEIGDALRRAS